MSGRKIYSTEFKLEIVERYLKRDIGIKKLAQEYHVSHGDIQKWRDAYQEHGVEGLSTTHRTYTGEFKVFVVEYMHNTGASIRKTAAHFNIPSFATAHAFRDIWQSFLYAPCQTSFLQVLLVTVSLCRWCGMAISCYI